MSGYIKMQIYGSELFYFNNFDKYRFERVFPEIFFVGILWFLKRLEILLLNRLKKFVNKISNWKLASAYHLPL